MANLVLLVIQLAVTVVVGIYFFRQLRQQKRAQPASRRSVCAQQRFRILSGRRKALSP